MRAAKAARDFQDFSTGLVERLGELLPQENVERSSVYLYQRVLPVLVPVVEALCAEQPADPKVFIFLTLAVQIDVPGAVLSDLRSLLDGKPLAASPVPSTGSRGSPHGSPHGSPSASRVASIRPPEGPPPCQRPAGAARRGAGSPICVASEASTAAPPPQAAAAAEEAEGRRPDKACEAAGAAAERDTEVSSVEGEDDVVASLRNDGGDSPAAAGSPRSTLGMSSDGRRRSSVLSLGRRSSFFSLSVSRKKTNYDAHQHRRWGSTTDPSRAFSWRRDSTVVCTNHALPPSREVLLSLLRKVPVFTRYPAEDLQRVADICVPCAFAPGEIITCAGEVSSALHIITEGESSIAEPQVCGQLGKGDFFGEQSLLDSCDGPAPLQVAALESGVRSIAVPRVEFEALKLRRCVERRAKLTNAHRKTVAQTVELSGLTDIDAVETTDRCLACGHRLVKGQQKSQSDIEIIEKAVRNNSYFSEVMQLTDTQCGLIANYAHLVQIPADTEVFKKGDIGTAFFIVYTGAVKIELGQHGTVTLRLGDCFGELAIMYDEPRNATVSTIGDCTLWVMPREHFQAVCKISAQLRLTEFADHLKKVPSLTSVLEQENFNLLADVLEETVFREGDAVCVAGEDVGTLYVLMEGECECVSKDDEDEPTTLLAGDWVGEQQLMEKLPAANTVVVCSEVARFLILDWDSFQIAREATKDVSRRPQDLQDIIANKGGIEAAEDYVSAKDRFRERVMKVVAGLRGVAVFREAAKAACQQRRLALGKCEVVGTLGEGSFGTVMLIRNTTTQREYALKALCKEGLEPVEQESMLTNERKLMSLLDSDFVVRLFQSYEDTRSVYLLTELAAGGELFDLYTNHDCWCSVPHATFYIANVAMGLSHIHSKRVVWRDLKLENCLLDERGYVKLADFGIGKLVLGKTYTVCGTADYFAPETLRQLGCNRAVDWWACGVLLFIMITGRSPFDAPEVQQIYKNIIKGIDKVKFPEACPTSAVQLIKGLCKKKPEDRVPMQKGGVDNLMRMTFFEEFAWDDLKHRTMPPPYVPPPLNYEAIAARKPQRDTQIDWGTLTLMNSAGTNT